MVLTLRKLISWKSAIPDISRACRNIMANDAAKKDAQPGMAQFVPSLIPATNAIAMTTNPPNRAEPINMRRKT